MKTDHLAILFISIFLFSCGADKVTRNDNDDLARTADTTFENADYATAFTSYLSLAKSGDKFAQYRVSLMYENGLGVQRDIVEAYAWSTVANEFVNADLLSYWMSVRSEIPEDMLDFAEQKSIEYYRKYSSFALSHEAVVTQYLADTGTSGSSKIEKRNEYLADHGAKKFLGKYHNDPALPCVVDELFNSGNYEDSFLLYLEAAKKGDKFAQYRVSYMYANGIGTSRNTIEAYAWAATAAELGSIIYVVNLRDLEHGIDPHDIASAREYAQEYIAKYGILTLAEKRQKELRKRKYSCTGSRVGNCNKLSIRTCDGPGNCRTELGFIEFRKITAEMKKIEFLTDTYIRVFGRVILRELELTETPAPDSETRSQD